MTALDESEEQPSDPSHPADWTSELGGRLKQARMSAGMSQQHVATALGYTTRSLTRWENGECDPGAGKLFRMADLFGVGLDWIAGRTSFERPFVPGKVLINTKALQALRELVRQGKRLGDVPKELLRLPGIDVGFVIPDESEIMTADAAAAVEAQVQHLLQQLKKR